MLGAETAAREAPPARADETPDSPARHPSAAAWWGLALVLAMLATAGFEALLTYIGFTLSIFSGLTVLGVFVGHGRATVSVWLHMNTLTRFLSGLWNSALVWFWCAEL